MIFYLNKEMVRWLKRFFPVREVKYHDISLICIGPGCSYDGVIIKEIEEIKDNK